jgi:hypothetical protein
LEIVQVNLDHVTAFTAAIQQKDLGAMLSQMAGNVVLNTPLIAEPIKGKAAIREIVGPLLDVVDAFDFREIMRGPEHVSSFFKVTVGTIKLDGVDYWLLDGAGLIKEMTVLWRPLPAVIAVRDKLLARAAD